MTPVEISADILARFGGQRRFAFFINALNVVTDEWMVALGGALRQRGHAAIGLLTPQAAARRSLDGLDAVYVLDSEGVEQLTSIHCFIVSDFEWPVRFPQAARVLGVIHSCTGSADPREYVQGAAFVGAFDGYLVGFPLEGRRAAIRALWQGFTPPAQQRRTGKSFYLMGYGYPKFCMLRTRLRAIPVTPDAICYAPTDIHHALHEGGERLADHGERLLRILLTQFPETTIIFRPTPLNRDEALVRAIARKFSGEPRFVLDTDTSYLHSFARSRVLLTDFAHSATSFLTLTGRRAFYFQPWHKAEQSRNLIPVFCAYRSLIAAIGAELATPEARDDAENAARQQQTLSRLGLLPFDNALAELADALPDFIDGKAHPEWIEIARTPGSEGASPARVVAALLRDYQGVQISLANFYAFYFNSPLLAVFAIHLSRVRTPHAPVENQMLTLSGLHAPGARTYADIPFAAIAEHYMLTLREDAENPAAARLTAAERAACLELADAALAEKSF